MREPLSEHEPEAGAAAVDLGADERLEQSLAGIAGGARPVIAYEQCDVTGWSTVVSGCFDLDFDLDRGAGLVGFGGVTDQVREDVAHAAGVDRHPHVTGTEWYDRVAEANGEFLDHELKPWHEFDFLEPHFAGSGEVEHPVHQPTDAGTGVTDQTAMRCDGVEWGIGGRCNVGVHHRAQARDSEVDQFRCQTYGNERASGSTRR